MGEIRTVTTLRAKREEISASVKLYEDRIKQARPDLAHVNACIKIFEASVCKETLASAPKSTRELALD
jgi:hypothetical protein